jgi:hypothetical protein
MISPQKLFFPRMDLERHVVSLFSRIGLWNDPLSSLSTNSPAFLFRENKFLGNDELGGLI